MSELKPQLGDFYWQDPFFLESQLTEDDRMLGCWVLPFQRNMAA